MRSLLLTMIVAAVCAEAPGQTLDERIAEVRRQHNEKAAAARTAVLQALLYRELTVAFDETPARDVFDFLRTALGIRIEVRSSDDAIGYGIDPDEPITLDKTETVALDVLELVLEQCSVDESCTWQIRRDYLEVGTKSRLGVPAAREVRFYPVDDLLYEPPDFDDAISLRLDTAYPWSGGYGGNPFVGAPGSGGYGGSISFTTPGSALDKAQRAQQLIDLIVDLVEPAAWRRNGGAQASISYREGALVVNAPAYIQRQLGGYPSVPPPGEAQASHQTPGTSR